MSEKNKNNVASLNNQRDKISSTSFKLAFEKSGLGGSGEEVKKKLDEKDERKEEGKTKIRESGEYKDLLDIFNSIKAGEPFKGYPDTVKGFLKECQKSLSFLSKDDPNRQATEFFLADYGGEMKIPAVPKKQNEPEERGEEKQKQEGGGRLSIEEAAKKISSFIGPESKGRDYLEIQIDDFRQLVMKSCTEGFVLRGHIKASLDKASKRETYEVKKHSNLDGEACYFLLKEIWGFNKAAGPKEKEYLQKTKYVFPGEIIAGGVNLNTGREEGSRWDFETGTIVIDHHGEESTVEGKSVFEQMINQMEEADFLTTLKNQEELTALKRLAWLVTAVDNFKLPKGVKWEDLWKTYDKNLFSICVAQQYSIKIENLFEFFKTHSFGRNVFDPLPPKEIDKILGQAAFDEKKRQPVSFVERQQKTKYNAEAFFKRVDRVDKEGRINSFTLFSKKYGRMLVVINEMAPGGPLAAFGHEYDAMLIWQPQKKSFFFNVRPGKAEIPHSLYEELGEKQAVWVRGTMLLQPPWRSAQFGVKKFNFSLLDLLEKLGISTKTLSPNFRKEVQQAEAE